jgi:hypothetical protein
MSTDHSILAAAGKFRPYRKCTRDENPKSLPEMSNGDDSTKIAGAKVLAKMTCFVMKLL